MKTSTPRRLEDKGPRAEKALKMKTTVRRLEDDDPYVPSKANEPCYGSGERS